MHDEANGTAPGGGLFDLVILNVLAVGGAFAFAAWARPQLPEKYPAHYNFQGEVDRWASASSAEWWLLPIVAASMAVTMIGLAYLMRRLSSTHINVPRKEDFVRLTPDKQAPIRLMVARYLLWIAMLDTLLFIGIHWSLFASAKGQSTWPAIAACVAVGVVFVVATVVGVLAMRKAVIAAAASG